MDNSRKIYLLLIIAGTLMVMIYAQSIILPFIIAVLFWFMIRIIKKLLLRIKFADRLPGWFQTIISTLILLGIAVVVVSLLTVNIQQLSSALPGYEENIKKITTTINDAFRIDIVSSLKDYSRDYNFTNLLSSTISAITGLFGDALMVVLYLLFILLEEPGFNSKLKAMYPQETNYVHMTNLIDKIDQSISDYLGIKTLVSLMTGACSFIVLLIIGVDAPLFWAFLIFILNFIPAIGSLVATVFPAVFALFQFGEFTQATLILAIVGSLQLVFGNFIEPRLMGNSLNISPLVVFLTLALWGTIWGITGMLLSVPITVILIIIMSEFHGTRRVAILLSRKVRQNE